MRHRAAGLILRAVLLATALAPPAWGDPADDPPPTRHLDRPRFSIDAGPIWTGDTSWVAVEIGVPFRELMFRAADTGFEAQFDLIVVLYDGKRQISGDLWHETARVRTQAQAREPANTFQRTIRLPGKPGQMRVEVTVSEPSSGNEGRLTQDVDVPDLSREPLVIGKIWFGQCPADSAGGESFLPDRPVVSRRFGLALGPICVWSRLYARAPNPDEPIHLEWQILDDRRETVDRDEIRSVVGGANVPIYFHLPLDKLWMGSYRLRLTARSGDQETVRNVDFEMDETVITLDHNPAESIALIRYIASADEIDALERAAPEDRQKAWDEFWASRGPDFKEEFFSRVRYANEHFSSLGPGWKTDRGMVYIQYGTPDQIESYPHNIDTLPYEVWSYFSLRRRFVFVDYDGFGRYELYTPGRAH
jgi:GWxTD domain-containing protein